MTNPTAAAGADVKGRPQGSLRKRIVIPLVLTVLAALAVMFFATRAALLSEVTDNANADVVQEIDEFERFAAEAVNPTTGLGFTDPKELVTVFVSRNIPGEREIILGLVESRGIIQPDFSALGGKYPDPLRLESPLVEEIRTSPANSGVFESSERGRVHWGRVTIQGGGDHEPATFAVASFVQDDINRAEQHVRLLGLIGLGLSLIAFAAAWFVASRVLSPIRELERVSSSITNSDLTSRVPVRGNDETARLAVTFNAMLDRIEKAYQDQRTFVDDAGHELRTPITVVRGQLELLEGASEEERHRSVELATAELDRMSRMVDDLLILAVSDAGRLVNAEEKDVAELLIDIEDKASTLSPRVQLVGVAEGTAMLDEQRITQAVLELCRNALRYSEGTVELSSQFAGEDWQITVRDHGPGIPEDKRELLFARFSRGEQPNSARPSGAGLGLSIVDAIARAHGGEVKVNSGPGAAFTISIPKNGR